MTVSTTWPALSSSFTIGSNIWPLVWMNCSMTSADSFAARVTMWYVLFTAVGSFRIHGLATGFYRTGASAVPTFN
jgi:hypothetical protein